MKYKAMKPCNFDTFYPIGAEVPESVLDSGRIPFLLDVGMLTELASEEASSTIGKPETEAKAEPVKKEADASDSTGLTASQLASMKKEDLITYAKDHGLDLDSGMTKDQIVEAIKLL